MPVDGVVVAGQPFTKRLSASITLPADGRYNWTEDWLTLAFAPGTGLNVEARDFRAAGIDFVAADASRGWNGIGFSRQGGPAPPPATLSGVRVSGTRTFLPSNVLPVETTGAAVTVANRSVVITDNSIIEAGPSGALVADSTAYPTNGVQVTGSGGRLSVAGLSVVRNHGGVGVLSTGGGRATVTEGATVLRNGSGGVRATGYGSRVDVTGLAQLTDNTAAGVRADLQGNVSVRSSGGTNLNTSVSNNAGGLYARSGAGVSGQQCDGTGGATRPNQFLLNYLTGYDALATGGSMVSARYAFWGVRSDTTLVTTTDGSSTLALYPRAPNADEQQPGCSVYGGTGPAGRATRSTAFAAEGDAAQARGPASIAVTALAAHAREAAWGGNVATAFATLAQAQAASFTGDDREAVSEAMAALLVDAQPASVVAGLEADATVPGEGQAWAQRSLAVAYAAGGRAADADVLALALTTNGETAHAAFGHGLRVRLATDAGDDAAALDRLSAFATLATESDDEALGSAVALVAAAFPGADLSGVLGVAGRSASRSAGRGASASETAAVAAGKTEAGASLNALDVYPNPAASGQATLRVTLAEATESAVATVYDALGRRVAVLHDGPLAAGARDFVFEASQFAPGVYVVHVRVRPDVGAPWTEVRRITVAR